MRSYCNCVVQELPGGFASPGIQEFDRTKALFRRKKISAQMPQRSLETLRKRYASLIAQREFDLPVDYAREVWTEEQNVTLASLAAEGLTVAQIARRMGQKPDSVRCRCKTMKLETVSACHRWTCGEEQSLLSMVKERTSWGEIALRLGPHRTPSAVSRHYGVMKKRGLRPVKDQKATSSASSPRFHAPSVTLSSIGGKRGYATKGAVYTSRTARTWTEDDSQTLVRVKTEGSPWTEIATELGRTVHSVRLHYFRRQRGKCFKVQRYLAAEDDKLERLRDGGMSWFVLRPHYLS